jgi:hypothetical protein
MSDDTTEADEVMSTLRMVEAVGGIIITAWMLWTFVVPVAVKIDLKAWWNEQRKRTPDTNRRAVVELHSALIDIELASESELSAAVERLAS